MIIILLEKSYTKCGGETSPRPFPGKLKLSISPNQKPKKLYSLFLKLFRKAFKQNTNERLLLMKGRNFQNFPKCQRIHSLKHNLYKKIVFIKFFSDYDLPNFAKENSCDKYPQIESEFIFYG